MLSVNPTRQEIFRARIFEEPLVPIGGEPAEAENAALATALGRYSRRSGPDDFSGLTGFLNSQPHSRWNPALLTCLGTEYYNTGHYSLALESWRRAWELGRAATDPHGKALADRAVGELAYMYARLGRMAELEALLKSIEDRVFSGSATEKICGAREGLHNMKNCPEIAFLCGPLALHRIKLSTDPNNPGTELIHTTASTQQGFSLLQLQELSQRLGLYFQMAHRGHGATLVVPSVAHLKLDHYAAMVRQEGDRYLLQDPTFGIDIWMTREALEAETSGYFLIPSGELPRNWRCVAAHEGDKVRGKGNVTGSDPGPHGPCDPSSSGGNQCQGPAPACQGMAVPRVHLMLVSLNINDDPVGYTPPVGPAVRFMVRYNQRDFYPPAIPIYSNFGPKWTFDWLSYITDNPKSPSADVYYYIMGGGTRAFTGFDSNTQSYAFQQYDQTKLTRTSPTSYEMLSRDGTKKVFGLPDGAISSSRRVFLTQLIDPYGNSVSLIYDTNFRIVAITDAIGQVTTISYENAADIHKITKITDPFGRFATFDYDASGRLVKITDVIGMTSEFTYDAGDFITTLTTAYGITRFTKVDPSLNSTTRALETVYPDGERDRVEFNQSTNLGTPFSDPPESVPAGMATTNQHLWFRNTYYWSKQACAYAYGDYTKAKIYHWLHTGAVAIASGILESVKEPLEGRVWYDYAGQPGDATGSLIAGSTNKPAHIGRVLDDGSTQLYTYEYNELGNVTKTIDPVGRTFSYIYAHNGIDLSEIRQTRAGQSELLSQMMRNAQHLPLIKIDAARQTTSYTYNPRGQVLTETNARNETTTYGYDADGHLTSIDGPLPEASVTFTYDAFGRVQTRTDESKYTLTFDYDALDRLAKVTYPDATSDQFTYTRLDPTLILDRAGRQTSFEYNSVRQITKRNDPLNRAMLYQWCKCGHIKSLTDPKGRTTTWWHDVQGRVKCKEYADGSKITYLCERTTSRLRHVIDEKLQVTEYHYNRDETVSAVSYANAAIATPTVSYTYDPNYSRVTAMTDIMGTTRYTYHPITSALGLGSGRLASIDGPLPEDAVTYAYDELGRASRRSINGVVSSVVFDAAARVTSETNALGTFTYTYDGPTSRCLSISYPNGQTATFSYLDNLNDKRLERINNAQGGSLISEYGYRYDVPAARIVSWSQNSGTEAPVIYTINYDAADQITSANGAENGNAVRSFGYSYDSAGNRLTEQIDGAIRLFSYNALNELTSADSDADPVVYQWDAADRLVSVQAGNRSTFFSYDGFGRRVGIREIVDGVEVSDKRYLWCDFEICEERTLVGGVIKRYFPQGFKVETGETIGKYFYTKDHLGSVRELIDDAGTVRARFNYDPYGSRSRIAGDLNADFGFAGYFFYAATGLWLAKFRAYDPKLGRWLSRDPLPEAEKYDANLYTYVRNDPVNSVDPYGDQIRPPAPDPAHPTGPTVPVPGPTSPTIPVPPPNPAPDIPPGQPSPYPGNPANPTIPRPPKPPKVPDWVWVVIIICGVMFFVRVPIPIP
jgi:RHS repeat-associated protein